VRVHSHVMIMPYDHVTPDGSFDPDHSAEASADDLSETSSIDPDEAHTLTMDRMIAMIEEFQTFILQNREELDAQKAEIARLKTHIEVLEAQLRAAA